MLSIQARTGHNGAYYLKTATEGYYLSGPEAGEWYGEGAKGLGLSGAVTDADFLRTFRGYDRAGRPLVQNAGKTDRKAGWDLTFSCPKSAAVVWAVGDADQRAAVERAHKEGVKAALGYIQRTAGLTRTGKGGHMTEAANLVVAKFDHATSRAGDPQPHTHCVVMNVGVRLDGKTGALASQYLYLAKMTAGAVYQAKVAAELEKAGLRTEATHTAKGRFLGTFEVAGVPKAVCDWFSKRREAIEAALNANGLSSAAAAAVATLATRPKKDQLPTRDELFSAWRAEADRLGFTREEARSLHQDRRTVDDLKVIGEALDATKKELSASVSHFTERELFRGTLVRTLGHAVEPSLVEKAVKAYLDTSPDIVPLGGERLAQHFTTKEVYDTERDLLASATALNERAFAGLRPKTVEEHVGKEYRPDPSRPGFTLKPEQKEAVEWLTRAGGDVRILSGYAGTGKTAVLRAVREAYERDGFTVVGASVAGAAAEQLEKGSGIQSDTVAMRFIEMNRMSDLGKSVWHHTKQALKTSANTLHRDVNIPVQKPKGPLVIDKNTVLVVDEAGMLGTKDLTRLMKAVETGGGKIILVGDHRQLPAIAAGGGFRGLALRLGYAELEDVTRQRSEWGRQKTKELADGQAEKVLTDAAERKLLTVARDRAEAVSKLLADWTKEGVRNPKEHMMLAATNAEVTALNTLAQKERQAAGLVRGPAVPVGGYAVAEGDRVIFRENSRTLGVKNGTFGTVVSTGGGTLTIRPDGEDSRGKPRVPLAVNIRKYDKLELGYAVTVFRSQGATYDASYVLLGGAGTSRQMAYVVGSRERETVRFYTDRHEAGFVLERLARGEAVTKPLESPLAKSMSRSAEKRLAHDIETGLGASHGPQRELSRDH